MAACKKCILTRTRILARARIALGFTIQDSMAAVKPTLEEAGFTVSICNPPFEQSYVQAYDKQEGTIHVICRSNGR